MAFFQLHDGTMFYVIPEQDGRFDMRHLAAPFGASVKNIQVSGFDILCADDFISFHTLEELRLNAKLLKIAEDGTRENPFSISVSESKPQKFLNTDAITSASNAAELCTSTFDKQHFYDFRPARTLPLGIFVKAFALARDVLVMDPEKVSPRAWAFVRELREEMPASFPDANGRPDQSRRQQAFTNCLRRYIADVLGTEFTVISNRERRGPDIKIHLRLPNRVPEYLIAGIEVRPEIGFNGEPSVENLINYSHEVSNSCYKDIYFTGYPMLLMELAGPNLRLAGAYFTDKAVYEPMTPYLSLLQLHDLTHLRQLGCMAMAIVETLAGLKNLYLGAVSLPMELQCEDVLYWPYRLRELYPAATLERLFAGKSVFRVMDPDGGRSKVVKFIQERYGAEAHRQWADCGHAPDFELEELPGSWNMVTMLWLGRDDGWFNLDDVEVELPSRWSECRQVVQDALSKVQSETKMVHGDIRAPNVIWNVNTGELMFVDFDWAGPVGIVRYPPLINPRLQWPDGVAPNVPILAQHDRDAVGLIFS